MSATALEWIAILLFLLLLVGVVIAEVMWLIRKQWAASGTSIAYVLLTDLLGFGIGATVVFVLFFVMFMMVMGPAGRGGTAPESAYWVITAICIILPPIFLIILKRLFLLIFKMKSGKAAWIYSIVSSLLTILITAVPPSIVFFLIAYVSSWKK